MPEGVILGPLAYKCIGVLSTYCLLIIGAAISIPIAAVHGIKKIKT